MVPRSRRCVSAASRTPTPDIQALISVRLPLIEPGQAPDVTHLAEREVEHMLRKEIQHSDRSFYRGKTRVELQQEACRELNRLPLSFLRFLKSLRGYENRMAAGSPGSPSPPLSPKASRRGHCGAV